MALVTEDGTGLADANCYIDTTFADAYFADRGVAAWSSLTPDVKANCCIKATDYIDTRWGYLFQGDLLTTTQALQFPRDAFTGIPTQLKKAVAEYALRASTADLAPDIEQDPTGYQVSRKFEVVGPITERTDYAFLGPGATRQLLKPYPAADMLLRPLLKSSVSRTIRN